MTENNKEYFKKLHPKKGITNNEKTFGEQVDDYFAGKLNRYNDLKVCDTPAILLVLGCEQLPMLYSQRHLQNAVKPKDRKMHHHGLSKDFLKCIPEMLSDPVMILDSLTRDDSLLAVLSSKETDEDNCPIVATIRPNGSGSYELQTVSSNYITSIYGREDFCDFIQRCIYNNKILFYNKKKSQELFSVLGLEFPEGLNNLDYNIIIHQSKNIVKHSPYNYLKKESYDKFFVNASKDTLINIHFDSYSDSGERFVISRIPLEVITRVDTDNSQEFFKILDTYSRKETINISDRQAFNSVNELLSYGKALFVGKNEETMKGLVKLARRLASGQGDSDKHLNMQRTQENNKQKGRK